MSTSAVFFKNGRKISKENERNALKLVCTRLAAKKKKKATKENDDRGGPPDENFRLAPGLDRRRALQSGGRSRRAIALERRRCQL